MLHEEAMDTKDKELAFKKRAIVLELNTGKGLNLASINMKISSNHKLEK